jgi:hypothetical protein
MRRIVLVLAVGLALVISLGVFLASAPAGVLSVTINDQEVEGPLRILAGGTAGLLGLVVLAFACLLTVFILSGASLLVAVSLAGAGVLLVLVGVPFLAPLGVVVGLWYLVAHRSRRRARNAA